MNTGLLSAYDFGVELLTTGDLDPVYILLHRAKLDAAVLQRWLLAYWWFYSMGTASRIAVHDGHQFFDKAHKEAISGAHRGTERRHFRGKQCVKSIEWFRKETNSNPEAAVQSLTTCRTFLEVRHAVMQWPMFGPWISFKIADMLERVLGWPVDFKDCDLLGLYVEPLEGAKLLGEQQNCSPEWALHRLINQLSLYSAPPSNDRPCGMQEAETVLCKWKSYMHGHYYVGKDWKEITEALRRSASRGDELSKRFLGAVPEGLRISVPEEKKWTQNLLFK